MYLLRVVDFCKYGLMQEETNSILYQRRHNDWSQNPTKTYVTTQVKKCHALQVHVVVKHVENLDVG